MPMTSAEFKIVQCAEWEGISYKAYLAWFRLSKEAIKHSHVE